MGRPAHRPTEETRAAVRTLAAIGTPHERIARQIGTAATTLRRRYRDELDNGATAADLEVARTLFEMATSGDTPAATIFWAKCRWGWSERVRVEATAHPPVPTISEDVRAEFSEMAKTMTDDELGEFREILQRRTAREAECKREEAQAEEVVERYRRRRRLEAAGMWKP